MPVSTAAGDGGRQSRPKAPGALSLGVAAVLAVLIAAVGITSRTAPPPTVAQFAPQAVQQIKEAPDEQTSEFGEGESGSGEGGESGAAATTTSTTSTTTTTTTVVTDDAPEAPPATRRCVGTPARQIEDTQSPPCVPFWQGDNGGATSKGVTADEIRIAVPMTDAKDVRNEVQAFENFFNERFEFYGRKLVLFNPEVSNSDSPEAQANDAEKVDSMVAFASTGYSYNSYYAQELARRQIISVTGEPYYDQGDLQDLAPYMWQYSAALDQQFGTLGAWACARVAGRKASHAGDPILHTQDRAFGVIGYNIYPELPVDLGPMVQRLEGCDAAPREINQSATVGTAISPTDAQNAMIQMKDAGVTSVICVCNNFQLTALMTAATSQTYRPEWIVSTYFFNDTDYAAHLNTETLQLDHMFGLTFIPRELRPENTPATWAVQEGMGQPDPPSAQSTQNMYFRRMLYHELLILASGIQMAGPTLTPQTFEQGLQQAQFPNPIEPSQQGSVNFHGDHSMTDDAAEFYWSSRAQSPYADMAGRGAFCYVDGGARRTIGIFPTTELPLGQLPCDSRDQ